VLICLTASHKNADFTALEALSTADASQLPSSFAAHPAVDGAVVVSTCNRFEVYLDVDAEADAAAAIAQAAASEALGAHQPETLAPLADVEAAEHLFAVAAGLESVVVGEGEIAGQVRRALQSAQAAGTTSPHLERLFQRASETQRGIKNRTGLGEAGRSIVRLALDLASARVDFADARVLLVGTGRFAGVSLAELRRRGAKHIEVWSPSDRGEGFARSHAVGYVDARDAALAAASADVIVTCTSADHHVVDAALLHAGRARLATHDFGDAHDPATCPIALDGAPSGCPMHSGDAAHDCPVEHGRRAQLVIDMGMPRNVDPDVASVHGVEVLDLETIRLHAPLEELHATDAARDVVREAAESFHLDGSRQSVTPAVVALRTHIFGLLEAEIDRARRRGDENGLVEQAMRHLAGVLLHTPTTRAHELAAEGRADEFHAALETLYGLSAESVAASDAATA